MALQNGDAFRFGRMRRQHRPHAQSAQLAADDVRRHPGCGCVGHDLEESAGDMLRPAIGLDLAPSAHRPVLLGQAEQLEHHALRLQRARKPVRRKRPLDALHDIDDVGIVPADHLLQKREQQRYRVMREVRAGRIVQREPRTVLHGRVHRCRAAQRVRASTAATVLPSSPALGATVKPNDFMISDFSAAESPAAEMMAPAWPMRRPFGAVSPAT